MSRNSEKATPVVAFFVLSNRPKHIKFPISNLNPDIVSTIIVNYRTPELLDVAVRSFQETYSQIRLLIIDNGSDQPSLDVIKRLESDYPATVNSHLLPENIFHGPAMDLGIKRLATPYVFILDSDTQTKRSGFIELMLDRFTDSNVYAVGQTATVNERGFASSSGEIIVPISAYMLLDRQKYLQLPPFVHHGLPVLNNIAAAQQRNWNVSEFPVGDYVDHFGRGTASQFGYGLGWRSKLDYLLNKFRL